MKNNIIIMGLIAIVFGAGGFFGGMKYQQSKSPSFGQFGGRSGMIGKNGDAVNRSGSGRALNFRPVNGEIGSFDGSMMTVKNADGTSKVVIVSDSTKITKGTDATKEELQTGVTIMVVGKENTDGSVTAESIQLNPEFRGMMRDQNPEPTQ